MTYLSTESGIIAYEFCKRFRIDSVFFNVLYDPEGNAALLAREISGDEADYCNKERIVYLTNTNTAVKSANNRCVACEIVKDMDDFMFQCIQAMMLGKERKRIYSYDSVYGTGK